MSETIKIVEVGARDGLQNESTRIWSVDERVQFIEKLLSAGIRHLEGGSFVSPKAIPQMQDSEKVWEGVRSSASAAAANVSFLVANEKGWERAVAASVNSIALFTATSSAFTQKNIGMTVEESLSVFKTLAHQAKAKKLWVRGYISTVFGCPYEGKQDPARAVEICEKLFAMGCDEVSMGDTIGAAHPRQVKDVFDRLTGSVDSKKLAGHFHDTRGMAIANILSALESGIRIFDSSVGGLGGCPYAPGASGNVATEEVVWLLEGAGFKTGINLDKLFELGGWLEGLLGRKLRSKLAQAHPKTIFYF